jgi:hypothetical protein
MLGSLFIVVSYLLFKSDRTQFYRTVVFLSIADFGGALFYLLGVLNVLEYPSAYWQTFICRWQAALLTFFEVASFLWTGTLAVTIFQIAKNVPVEDIRKQEIWWHCFCWGYATFVTLGAALDEEYGPAGSVWCWIDNPRSFWRVVAYYGVDLIVIVGNFCLYFIVLLMLRYQVSKGKLAPQLAGVEGETEVRMMWRITRRLMLYPLVFILSQSIALVNRYQNALCPSHPIIILYLLQACTQPTQGFFNACVYALNSNAIKNYYLAIVSGITSLRAKLGKDRPEVGLGESLIPYDERGIGPSDFDSKDTLYDPLYDQADGWSQER